MESEKVKEIKKALECCTNIKEKCDNKKCYLFDKLEYHYCERQLKTDILTLINELESENERLILQYERVKADSEMNCLELKDRIDELEKENAKLNIELDKRDCIDYPCRLIEKEHLKQFAEKIYNMAKITVNATKHIVQGKEYLHLDALKEIIKSCGIELKEQQNER